MINSTIHQVTKDELYRSPPGIVIRAGAVITTTVNGVTYLLLGMTKNGFYTDMGGGCKSSLSEAPIDCLIREINEETDAITARTVIAAIETGKITVWRQTAKTFSQLGYPFIQYNPGPIYRYYVIVNIDDATFHLGGPTGKDEVVSYEWRSLSEVTDLGKTRFNRSLIDFFIYQEWVQP